MSLVAYFLSFIKFIGGPGSSGFFIAVALTIVIALRCWPARRRWAIAAFAMLVTFYGVLALPPVGIGLVDALPESPEPSGEAIRNIRALVVFDGDNRLGRQRRTHQVLRQASPQVVWILGPEHLVADARVALVPPTRLHQDATTWNTAAQVERVKHVAAEWPPMTTAVIASRIQMPRIAALFDAAGLAVLLVPSGLDRAVAVSGPDSLLPSFAALAASREAIYEHAALGWYRWRGVIE